MKTYKYLYDKEEAELPSMHTALKARVEAAKALLIKLHEVPLLERDDARINAVIKAISHNRELLSGKL